MRGIAYTIVFCTHKNCLFEKHFFYNNKKTKGDMLVMLNEYCRLAALLLDCLTTDQMTMGFKRFLKWESGIRVLKLNQKASIGNSNSCKKKDRQILFVFFV